jgi:hypothetical protein
MAVSAQVVTAGAVVSIALFNHNGREKGDLLTEAVTSPHEPVLASTHWLLKLL